MTERVTSPSRLRSTPQQQLQTLAGLRVITEVFISHLVSPGDTTVTVTMMIKFILSKMIPDEDEHPARPSDPVQTSRRPDVPHP